MPLKVSFELEDADLQHFAEAALQSQAIAREQPEEAVVAAARDVLERGMQAQPAPFVKERYTRLHLLLEMLADPDWRLSDEDRRRAVNALACFSAPARAAGNSFDYAVMIELLGRDLHHDLAAYQDFRRFRNGAAARRAAKSASREQWLAQKREALQARMHKRRMRELDAAGGALRRFLAMF